MGCGSSTRNLGFLGDRALLSFSTNKALAHGKSVNFTVLKDRASILSCTGFIYSCGHINFISMQNNNNSAVFDALGLNAKEFV